jgi:hypothetical protein
MQTASINSGTGSAFRIRRPLSTSNGFVSDIDPRVKDQLVTLEKLVGARVFDPDSVARCTTGSKRPSSASASAAASAAGTAALDPHATLKRALTPQRGRGTARWAADSLADVLHKASTTVSPDKITLAEFVDRVSELSTLKYAVDNALANDWFTLSENSRRVLDAGLPAVRIYLVAHAYLTLGLRDPGAVKNFILNDRLGAPLVADYAIVGAARDLVADKGFNIPGYDEDDGEFVTKIRAAGIGLSSARFGQGVQAVVADRINDIEHADLIAEAEKTVGPLPLSTKRLIALYIDAAPVPITKANIAYFATAWLSQLSVAPSAPTDPSAPSDDDFDIDVFTDDDSAIQISRSAILCSAQLYYSMVLGEELAVLAVVHYFTHKYLVRGGMEVNDGRLRDDLQAYVFSNRFTDLKTGRVLDRTRPAEREMFYRQVFSLGRGEMPGDLIVNDDFTRLWKVLMLESATYLERAQASLNPDGFVSRQKVMQAVEDLQYNLSTHCTGMATVIAPLIHAELNFAIRRILMHPEVLKQVVPIGGTWWRVVERLYMEMKHARPKATVFHNKAKLGHDIIASIADYNPATFESDAEFSAFISNIDAYITTQSILQEVLTDDLKRQQEDPVSSPAGYHQPPGSAGAMPAMVPAGVGADGASANGHAPADEWDF